MFHGNSNDAPTGKAVEGHTFRIVQHHADHRSIGVGHVRSGWQSLPWCRYWIATFRQPARGSQVRKMLRVPPAILVILAVVVPAVRNVGGTPARLSGIKADHRPVWVAQHTSPALAATNSPPTLGYTTAASATAESTAPSHGTGTPPTPTPPLGRPKDAGSSMASWRWAARQGDQVGLPLVIKLPVRLAWTRSCNTPSPPLRTAVWRGGTVPLEMSKAAATCGAFHPAPLSAVVRARAMMRGLLPLRISWLSRSLSSGPVPRIAPGPCLPFHSILQSA